MRDDDRLLDLPEAEFGSGVIGVCDICGERQAVVVLTKERFRLCVLDFLNKTWLRTEKAPSHPAPLYRSERVEFETTALPGGRAPAIVLTPTKVVRHPAVLVVPDLYGITTTLLDGAIRFAREGFEVLIPDLGKTDGVGPMDLAAMRAGRLSRGGVSAGSPRVTRLVGLYTDALRHLTGRPMVDPARTAVFGVSYGGTLALVLAAESTAISAVALAYPAPVRPLELPGLVTAPVLVVHGAADRLAVRAVHEIRATPAGTTTGVVELPRGRHGFLSRDLRAYDVAEAEEAWSRVVAFLKERLMPPPPRPPPPPSRQAAAAVTPATASRPASLASAPAASAPRPT